MPSVALIGPRQVGKTTLALRIGEAHDAVDGREDRGGRRDRAGRVDPDRVRVAADRGEAGAVGRDGHGAGVGEERRAVIDVRVGAGRVRRRLLVPDVRAAARQAEGARIALAENGVKTRDDLADLASDELREIVGESAMDAETANAIIMKAREHWFPAEEAAAAEPAKA